jgi:hypothetical protein
MWLIEEPTSDSSSDTSSTPEPLEKEGSSHSSNVSLVPEDSNMRLVEGGQTFIVASDEPRRSLSKRRQSTHRRQFHNVIPHTLNEVDGS